MSDFLTFAADNLPSILEKLPVTLGLWAIAMVLGSVLALFLAWARIYGGKTSYYVSTVYVELFRGTPMLVQMFFIYLGLPELGLVLDPFSSAAIAIGLNTAAYQAEYLRGAILAVPAGQMQAARAMGMSRFSGLRWIVLPQALRRMIPSWSNEAILELKFTSIAYAIGVVEMTAQAESIGYTTYRFFDSFLLVALVYLVLTNIVASFLSLVEYLVQVPGLGQKGA